MWSYEMKNGKFPTQQAYKTVWRKFWQLKLGWNNVTAVTLCKLSIQFYAPSRENYYKIGKSIAFMVEKKNCFPYPNLKFTNCWDSSVSQSHDHSFIRYIALSLSKAYNLVWLRHRKSINILNELLKTIGPHSNAW